MTNVFEEVDRLVDTFVAGEPVPGVAYGVIVDGELVHTRGIGTADVGSNIIPNPDTVFRIASMTKSFTAATVLLLRDEGRLHLDDPVAMHVPELQGQRSSHDGAPAITLRHLLSMSAGFPGDDPWGDRQQDLDPDSFSSFLEGGQSFAFMPGTAFEYSNLGYAILGRVITNVTGQEYRDVVRSRVLEPMGMTSTGYDASEFPAERLATGYVRRDDGFVEEPIVGYGSFASMGGLLSTVSDLARWVDGFARAYAPRDHDDHPLSRASRLEMQQAHRMIEPELTWTSIAELPIAFVAGYGFGTFVRSDMELGTVVGHSGGYPGFGSHMRWHPASGVGVVVLGNRTYFPALKVGELMLRALVRAEVAPIRRLAPSPALETARDAVERLLAAWDGDLAASTFSMNVDMDEPIVRRRAAIERLRETHGPLHRSDEAARSDTPLHVEWWLDGEPGRGRVRVEVTLDPQPVPKVQYLELTSVPEPDPRLRLGAEALLASANEGSAEVPPLGEGVDRGSVDRDIVLVRTLFGASVLGSHVAADASNATFRVIAERGTLDLALSVDDDGRLSTVTWTPRPVKPPPKAGD